MTVTLNSVASNSLIASYDANLWINNLTDGTWRKTGNFDLLVWQWRL